MTEQVENPASNPDSTMDEAAEESPSPAEEDDETDDGEEETSGIKLETAPGDIRFPTANQTRHCCTRYMSITGA